MEKSTRIPLAFLGIGTVLFALGPALLKLLTTMSGRFGIVNPGAISFCNVLFVGNFCAGALTLAGFGPGRILRELAALPPRVFRILAASALLSTVYPALLFTALERTSVIDVVLLSRFNGIVFVALSFLWFKTPIARAQVAGYAVIGLGVAALVVTRNQGLLLSSGEWLVLASTVFFALTEFASKAVLKECSIELYLFFRNLVSSVLFFAVALYLFGPHHFADAFAGEVWVLMVIYAGVAVVAAQLSWLKATRVLPVETVANSQLLNPAISILFAYALLGETPTGLEWLTMGIVAAGTIVPLLFIHGRSSRERPMFLAGGMVGTH